MAKYPPADRTPLKGTVARKAVSSEVRQKRLAALERKDQAEEDSHILR